jgi:hypothetical protein
VRRLVIPDSGFGLVLVQLLAGTTEENRSFSPIRRSADTPVMPTPTDSTLDHDSSRSASAPPSARARRGLNSPSRQSAPQRGRATRNGTGAATDQGGETPREGGALNAVGWRPDADLDQHAWAVAGRRMSAIDRASQWWIGDWLRYGTERWGEKYTQAARITGYDVPSLRNMAWLASEFEISRRRDTLTWSHHAAVAALEPEQQDTWLDRASEEHLSVADLRGEIRTHQRAGRAEGNASDDDGPHHDRDLCPTCGQKLPQASKESGAPPPAGAPA